MSVEDGVATDDDVGICVGLAETECVPVAEAVCVRLGEGLALRVAVMEVVCVGEGDRDVVPEPLGVGVPLRVCVGVIDRDCVGVGTWLGLPVMLAAWVCVPEFACEREAVADGVSVPVPDRVMVEDDVADGVWVVEAVLVELPVPVAVRLRD